MRHRWLTVGALVLLGCSAPPAAPPPGARDSAGVEIVTYAEGSEEQLPLWTVDGPPLVDIGREGEPGQDLHLVAGATRLSDRRIVVAIQSPSQLRFFDSTGGYLFPAGRPGRGPGEFGTLATVQRLRGDSLYAFDSAQRLGSLFDSAGKFLRSQPILVRLDQGYIVGRARLDDGRLLGTSDRFPVARENSGPVRRDSFALVLLGPGQQADTFAILPGDEVYPALTREAGREFPSIQWLEFGRETVYATDGARIFVGSNEAGGIRAYDASGKLKRIIRTATPAEPVTSEDRKRRAAENLARIERTPSSEQFKAEWRKNEEAKRYAEWLPFYERLLVGTDGTLWVEGPRHFSDQGRRYVVYDSSGRAIARVRCLDRFRPYEVGPAEVLGLWRDAEELHHVRVYKVRVKSET